MTRHRRPPKDTDPAALPPERPTGRRVPGTASSHPRRPPAPGAPAWPPSLPRAGFRFPSRGPAHRKCRPQRHVSRASSLGAPPRDRRFKSATWRRPAHNAARSNEYDGDHATLPVRPADVPAAVVARAPRESHRPPWQRRARLRLAECVWTLHGPRPRPTRSGGLLLLLLSK